MSDHEHSVLAYRSVVAEWRGEHYVETGACCTCEAAVHRVWGPTQNAMRDCDPWNRFRLTSEPIGDQWPTEAAS